MSTLVTEDHYRGYNYFIILAKHHPDFVERIKSSSPEDFVYMNKEWHNGYIQIPEHHPLHEFDYLDDNFPDLDVHGGVTFSKKYSFRNLAVQVEQENELFLKYEGTWCIGFDCNHLGDTQNVFFGGYWKDSNFVECECKKLIDQLIELEGK